MKNIALIGSTGSIGKQVLDVVRNHPKDFKIVAMTAGRPSELFESQVAEFKPYLAATFSENKELALSVAGFEGADIVFNAAGGFAGIAYSIRAIEHGKTLALANKETLVCGGEFITGLARKKGVEIIPVDSEHSAIWQCLDYGKRAFERLIITASGGAFRGKSFEELKCVTPEQALNHPTWQMGKKITIDSATLMNKGYEVIEAHILFNAPYNKIKTVIQPQSIVHSLVEFADGACIAQMSLPTMELPIQLALTYPERLPAKTKKLDFDGGFNLNFERLERKNYPLYDIALTCGERGGTLPCALNAADETAVGAFLERRISFTDIHKVVSEVINGVSREDITGFEQLCEVDRHARELARKVIENI